MIILRISKEIFFHTDYNASPFAAVPDEIITEIFQQLSVRDIGRVARVCKRFSKIDMDDRFWKRIALKLGHGDVKMTGSYKELIKQEIITNDFIAYPYKSYLLLTTHFKDKSDYIPLMEKALNLFPKQSCLSMAYVLHGGVHALSYIDKTTQQVTTWCYFAKTNMSQKDAKTFDAIVSKRKQINLVYYNSCDQILSLPFDWDEADERIIEQIKKLAKRLNITLSY